VYTANVTKLGICGGTVKYGFPDFEDHETHLESSYYAIANSVCRKHEFTSKEVEYEYYTA